MFDPVTGARTAGFRSTATPALAPGGLGYFVDGGQLVAASPSSFASPAWRFAGDGQLATSPLLIDGTVFVASTGGMLYAIDAASGVPRWTTTMTPPAEDPQYQNAGVLTGAAVGEGWFLMPGGSRLNAWKVVP